MTVRLRNPAYIAVVFFLLMLVVIVFPAVCVADEVMSDPSEIQRSFRYSQTDVVLQKITENIMIVNDERYVFNPQTSVDSDHPDSPIERISEIPYPALVSIVYQTYSQRTEDVPYPPGTKVVQRITFLQRLTPEEQNHQPGTQE